MSIQRPLQAEQNHPRHPVSPCEKLQKTLQTTSPKSNKLQLFGFLKLLGAPKKSCCFLTKDFAELRKDTYGIASYLLERCLFFWREQTWLNIVYSLEPRCSKPCALCGDLVLDQPVFIWLCSSLGVCVVCFYMALFEGHVFECF